MIGWVRWAWVVAAAMVLPSLALPPSAWADSGLSRAMNETRLGRGAGQGHASSRRRGPILSHAQDPRYKIRTKRLTASFFVAASRDGHGDLLPMRFLVEDMGDPLAIYLRVVSMRVTDPRTKELFFEHFRQTARNLGIRDAHITQPRTGDPAGTVLNDYPLRRSNVFMVAVDQYQALAPVGCLDGQEALEIGGNVTRRDGPGLGCSQQSNLAAMVAEPRDLRHGRDLSLGRSERLRQAFQRYLRGGGNTTSQNVQRGVGN